MKGNKFLELTKKLLLKLQGLSRTQAIIATVCAVVTVGGVGTGGYLAYDHNHQSKDVVAEATETIGVATEVLEIEPETEELITAEVLVTEETETAEVEKTELSLVGTSIEKDLKIKVQDQNNKLVSGETFSVSVKKGTKSANYKDEDKDGIIYIDEIEAGKYTVELAKIDGYEIKKGTITVEVKENIEYKAVDIEAEIKSESQVNVAVEDTANNSVPVEATLTDTIPLIESTASATTVAKADVDTSNFTKASASSENISVTLQKKQVISSTESTETPGSTESETTGSTETETTGSSETETTGSTETETTGSTETETTGSTETETQMPEEAGTTAIGADIAKAYVERNDISRVGTSNGTALVLSEAVVAMPKTITLYDSTIAASNSYAIKLSVADNNSIIKSISWSSADATVASLSATSGSSVTVKAGKKGSTHINVTITYVADEKGNTATASLQSVVTVSDFTDSTTQLKNKSGNLLYLDQRALTPAMIKDYNTTDKFYTSPKYTGWQTLDGKVYYYNANNQAVTGEQVIGGVKYTFSSDGSLSQSSGSRGIDVSKWQGNIDWGAVASSGISFAIIRAGYRGASTGVLVEDPYFKSNIAGATRAGIKVGVYFFTQAINEAEAVEEASMVLSLVSGYKVTYPIFIDTENASGGRANGLDVATRTAVVKAFCQTIQNGGRKAGVYASKSWYNNKLNASALNGYCIWVAQYNTSCTYSGKYDMWQYSSKGTVSGIKGNVDMNISYLGY